jgi:hypothetical protein
VGSATIFFLDPQIYASGATAANVDPTHESCSKCIYSNCANGCSQLGAIGAWSAVGARGGKEGVEGQKAGLERLPGRLTTPPGTLSLPGEV